MLKEMMKYVRKAVSKSNRCFNEDNNHRYRVDIQMAEVGGKKDGEGNFWFEISIPRQVNNDLGMTFTETVFSKEDAVAVLKSVIAELEK